MSSAECRPPRFRTDDLRRFAAALARAVGISPTRATALAGHLLWYDESGIEPFGIGCLPDWLERIEQGAVDARADGRVLRERPATALLDGQNGITPLILARAAGIAAEKAREVGSAVVRILHLEPAGPAAEVAAGLALGPITALIAGPRPSTTLALPTAAGLPVVLDTDLGAKLARSDAFGFWAAGLAPPPGGWLVTALSVADFEPLAAFQQRLGDSLPRREVPGLLLPGPWAERRRAAHEQGITLRGDALARLERWADRLGVPLPQPDP